MAIIATAAIRKLAGPNGRREGANIRRAAGVTVYGRSMRDRRRLMKEERPMTKTLPAIGLAAALALLSGAALAEQGDSSSWGTVGWGPVIPTQALTPKERAWNVNNTPLYQAENSAEWLRQHGKGLFPFFR
jgi:hypothetical protein